MARNGQQNVLQLITSINVNTALVCYGYLTWLVKQEGTVSPSCSSTSLSIAESGIRGVGSSLYENISCQYMCTK